jgi:hypothetical protein
MPDKCKADAEILTALSRNELNYIKKGLPLPRKTLGRLRSISLMGAFKNSRVKPRVVILDKSP